eukprot:1029791-Pyramimonas_sp.AAC.1
MSDPPDQSAPFQDGHRLPPHPAAGRNGGPGSLKDFGPDLRDSPTPIRLAEGFQVPSRPDTIQ